MGKTKVKIFGDEPASTKGAGKTQDKKRRKHARARKEKGVHISGLKGGERIVAVSGDPISSADGEVRGASEQEKTPTVEVVQKEGKPRVRGKKYLAALAKLDPEKKYTTSEAARLVKETSVSSFDGSVDLSLVFAKDRPDINVELPHSTGAKKKVEVASKQTVSKLKKGKIDFDVLLATPEMMPKLVPFAKILGPRGLMPNPKHGTLVDDPEKARHKFGENSLNIKLSKDAPIANVVIGNTKQPEQELEDNLKVVIDTLGARSIKKAVVSASMGPGIKLAVG